MTAARLAQLVALRNRLNALGNHYYLSDAATLYVRPDQFSAAWNARRIRARNRINRRLAMR